MNRHAHLCATLFPLCATAAWSAQPATVSHRNQQAVDGPNAAAALLATPVPSVDWSDATLDEVIEWLRDLGDGRVNVMPRWDVLSLSDVGPDARVAVRLANTTVADTLNETLRMLAPDGSLGYQAERNYLTISTKQDLDSVLYLKVYDATDLVFEVTNFGAEAPQIDLQQTGNAAGTAGQGVFSGSGRSASNSGEEEQETRDELVALRDVIVATIAPESWGGPFGSGPGRIAVFRRSLLVDQTAAVQEQIAGTFVRGE